MLLCAPGRLLARNSDVDFSRLRIGAESMVVYYHAHNGTVLYTTPPIPKRTKVPQPDPGPPGPLCGKAPGGPGCEHPPSPPL